MTAEVAILNREAVALAADSAATLSVHGDLKIYNTTKLFTLSEVEPIAVMFYGSGYFGPVPWETIVKKYRSQTIPYNTVDDHASGFIDYVASFVKYTSDEDQNELVRVTAMSELQDIWLEVTRRIQTAKIVDNHFSKDKLQPLVLECIEERIRDLEKLDPIAGISASIAGRQLGIATDNWEDFVSINLGNLPVNRKIVQRARVMVRRSLMVVLPLHPWNPWCSGVVVTGFGTDQIFPALSHYLVDGVIAGKVRARHICSEQISEEQPAKVRAFGQDDMVRAFMEGMDINYTRRLEDYRTAREHFYDRMVEDLVQYFDNYMGNPLPSAERSKLLRDMEKMRVDGLKKLDSRINDYRDYHPRQIRAIVKWLPKEELAEMAEVLVNLTSFKRRVTPVAETVGGPIDVAVISKGDGLVWIKRNLYFEPKLNRQLFDFDRK